MERAARLFKKNKYSREILSDSDIVRGLWQSAVGKAISRHTWKLTVVRETLVVEVEDAMWQRQLFPLSGQIIGRLQKLTGSSSIEKIEFRVGVPKRHMKREESVRALQLQEIPGASELSTDEADQILDPVLKKLYRISRKRATA